MNRFGEVLTVFRPCKYVESKGPVRPVAGGLRRSIKKLGPMPAKKVKEAGLDVFLATVFR